MKISCLMPTYNRIPNGQFMVEEALHSFLLQDYEDSELIICNDTPNQKLEYDDDRVIIMNLDERFETLSDKIQYMIDNSNGEYLCRWDDDDISLPHRLSYSIDKLTSVCGKPVKGKLEWRADNYFYCPKEETHYVAGAGNTHVMSLWHRDVLGVIGGYPPKASGWEDQAFNQAIYQAGVSEWMGEEIPAEDIYYLYRWGVSDCHLSGTGGGNEGLQNHWDEIGQREIQEGTFELDPHWMEDYSLRANDACEAFEKETIGK